MAKSEIERAKDKIDKIREKMNDFRSDPHNEELATGVRWMPNDLKNKQQFYNLIHKDREYMKQLNEAIDAYNRVQPDRNKHCNLYEAEGFLVCGECHNKKVFISRCFLNFNVDNFGLYVYGREIK